MDDFVMPIYLKEEAGIPGINEPVTLGIPFPRGVLYEHYGLKLVDNKNSCIPYQAIPTAFWGDKSLKWVLIDFQATGTRNWDGFIFYSF